MFDPVSEREGPQPVKAVLFDLLSALLDSWSLWDDITGDGTRGRAWRMEYLRRTYETGAYVPYLDLVADAAAATGLPRDHAAALAERWGELEPWPDAGRTLRKVGSELPLGVATNCSDDLGRRAADRVGATFDAVVTAEAVGCYKPDPRIYLAGVEALGAEMRNVLFVAGSPLDVEGARAAGLRVAWHNPAGLRAPAAERGADAVLTELTQLNGYLGD